MVDPLLFKTFPDDLPRPVDDGEADHLTGLPMPDVVLPSTMGQRVALNRIPGRVVIYAYPMTGQPDVPLPAGWNDIPGARGCTPESLGFKAVDARFSALGIAVFGLSTQDTDYQREMAQRLGLPFPVLSDAGLALTHALRLPTMEVAGMTLLKRLTLIVRDGVIEQVFYPVFPPDEAAATVLAWLESQAS
ncbi:peroxiredoxin [Castellaniella sp. MT123]|uniref:peroxiredoxin n=1 Tax=Castellaniella sp. MT123 TaxID=3140381 RepID=UPI0031F4044C